MTNFPLRLFFQKMLCVHTPNIQSDQLLAANCSKVIIHKCQATTLLTHLVSSLTSTSSESSSSNISHKHPVDSPGVLTDQLLLRVFFLKHQSKTSCWLTWCPHWPAPPQSLLPQTSVTNILLTHLVSSLTSSSSESSSSNISHKHPVDSPGVLTDQLLLGVLFLKHQSQTSCWLTWCPHWLAPPQSLLPQTSCSLCPSFPSYPVSSPTPSSFPNGLHLLRLDKMRTEWITFIIYRESN